MTDAYTTTPGQAGTFVLQERKRLENENRQLKQMLIVAWRFMQDESAEDCNRMNMKAGWAETIARHLEELGVPVDVNVFAIWQQNAPLPQSLPERATGREEGAAHE